MTTPSQKQKRTRRPLIAVIGDAGVLPGSKKYKLAEGIGRALVDAGYRVLTGGLGGVMEAASRGAKSSARTTPGDTVGILPGYDPDDANPFVDIPIASGMDHLRNSIVARADAVIAIGGGAGTLSEMCFAWMNKRLIIALRVEGWSGRLADQRLDERVRYPRVRDDRIYGADDVSFAIRLLNKLLRTYNAQHRGIRRKPS